MDTRCSGDSCKALKSQSSDEAAKCTLPQTVKEEINGCESMSPIPYDHPTKPSPGADPADQLTGVSTIPGRDMDGMAS